MRIGVFDSGIGGEAIAASIAAQFPEATLDVVNDRDNVPYGDKSANEVIRLTKYAIQPLLANKPDIIVIACNTATALAIDTLRRTYPKQWFIGLEPMIKPARQLTKTDIIAVCATPATLKSQNYARLKADYAGEITILEPDTREWARLIEDNQMNRERIEGTILPLLEQSADVIVLACTHYHWIKQEIESLCNGRAIVLEPSDAIARRISSLLKSP